MYFRGHAENGALLNTEVTALNTKTPILYLKRDTIYQNINIYWGVDCHLKPSINGFF
jgi:hypothetical protein